MVRVLLGVIAHESGDPVTTYFDWGAVSRPLYDGYWIACFASLRSRFRSAAVSKNGHSAGRGHPSRRARKHGLLRLNSDLFTGSFARNDRSGATRDHKLSSSRMKDLL
jgi:hypothetical protein